MTVPVQEFQIGQRVRIGLCMPFEIRSIYQSVDRRLRYCAEHGATGFSADRLTLCPERPPYVSSERRVVGRSVTIARYQPELYRCETDTELAARHADERAEYDAQGDGA